MCSDPLSTNCVRCASFFLFSPKGEREGGGYRCVYGRLEASVGRAEGAGARVEGDDGQPHTQASAGREDDWLTVVGWLLVVCFCGI